jgi:hypothetical protein
MSACRENRQIFEIAGAEFAPISPWTDRRFFSGGVDGDAEFAAAGTGEAFEGFDPWRGSTVFPCGDG